MKVSVKKLPKSEVELTIELDSKEYAKYEKQCLEKLSNEKSLDGFRKGKVPEKVLREKYGDNVIKAETLEIAINNSFLDAVNKKKLQALEMPRISIESNEPLKFTATCSIMPEVTVPELKTIKLPKASTAKISKKEVDEVKKTLQEKNMELKKQDRKAKKDDLVEVDFEGFDEDGVSLEGTQSKHHPVVIGSNSFVPGFEENLIGVKAGDEKEFTVTFPKDYAKESFQNKKVKFKVKVHDVFERVIPKFDKALIKKLTGKEQEVKDMEKEIKEALTEKHAQDDQKRRQNEFLASLAKVAKGDIPSVLVERELDGVMEDMKNRVLQSQNTWENYLKQVKKTEEEIRKEVKKQAEKNVLTRLAFQQLLQRNMPQVNEKDIELKIAQMMMSVPPQQKDEAAKYFQKNSEGWQELKWEITVEKFFADLFKEKK